MSCSANSRPAARKFESRLAAVLLAVLVAMPAVEAAANHPGSHAARMADGRVRIVLSAVVPDGCTTIGSMRIGAPSGVDAPEGSMPVTARYRRQPSGGCTMALRNIKAEALFEGSGDEQVVHLYVLDTDGKLVNSERLPIRAD